MGFCEVCQSAGSVNRYGFCEICGTTHQSAKVIEMPGLAEMIEPRSVYEVSRSG